MLDIIQPFFIKWDSSWPALCGAIYRLSVSPALAAIDLRERRLPNRLVLPAIPLALAGQAWAVLIDQTLWSRTASAVIATVLIFAFAVFANQRGQLGMGDAKLMAAMTLSLGWFTPLAPFLAMLASFVSAGGFVLVQAVRRRSALTGTIPLGPYLLLGNLIGVASLFVR